MDLTWRGLILASFLVVLSKSKRHNIKVNGMVEYKRGEVEATVTANQRPHNAYWILPTHSKYKLTVEEQRDVKDYNNYYVGHPGKDNGDGTYTYRLSIASGEKRDSDPGIEFDAFIGAQNEHYLIRADTSSLPEQDLTNGLLISAICVVAILLLTGMSWRYKRIWKRKAPQFPVVHKVVHPDGPNAYDNQACYISHSDIHLHLPPPPNSLKCPTAGQYPTKVKYPTPTASTQYLNASNLYLSVADSSSVGDYDYIYDDVLDQNVCKEVDSPQHIYESLDKFYSNGRFTDFDRF